MIKVHPEKSSSTMITLQTGHHHHSGLLWSLVTIHHRTRTHGPPPNLWEMPKSQKAKKKLSNHGQVVHGETIQPVVPPFEQPHYYYGTMTTDYVEPYDFLVFSVFCLLVSFHVFACVRPPWYTLYDNCPMLVSEDEHLFWYFCEKRATRGGYYDVLQKSRMLLLCSLSRR